MEYPSRLDLLVFFAAEPIIEDDIHTYQVQDSSGVVLVFTFDESDQSVQTVVKQDERIVSLTSNECMTRMWIDGETFRADFECNGYRTRLELMVRPFVKVEWSGIRIG